MLRVSFNDDWFVRREGVSGTPVGPVSVPYDAMLFEQRDADTANSLNTGYYPGGVYRYSKTFSASEAWRGRSITVEFEGVYLRSEVFVNGRRAGGRPSGYAVFHVVLDEFLGYGEDNLIEVVAHNDRSPNSRWYTGSGIYRPVHLLVGEPLHVTPHGLRVSTRSLTGTDAVVAVSTEVVNGNDVRSTFDVAATLHDSEGTTVGSGEQRVTLEAGATQTFVTDIAVTSAEPWSPDSPRLHEAVVVLKDGEQKIDTASTDFGIRIIESDAVHGLRINGQPVKLRGACIHHDNGVIGAHTLDAAEDRRIRILKESGFNAIRSAHNPASSATLRACDRHGVLVMDELTDVWWRTKTNWGYQLEFEQEWERDLAAMVANDVNHPSVILYSIGNEIAETATEKGIELSRRMADRTRELDPTRLVTNGINGFLNLISSNDDEKLAKKAEEARASGEATSKNLILILNLAMGALDKVLPRLVRLPTVDKRTRDAFAPLDVAGYNYMAGRYAIDTHLHRDRVMVGSETSPTDTVRIWQQIDAMPNVIGDFVWTGWDYLGEAGLSIKQYDQPRRLFQPFPALTAATPIIDITGHRQTQSYLNEIAYHRRRGPFLAVEPLVYSGKKATKTGWRATNSIRSWSWEGHEGRTATVEIYADAARVELRSNGELIGSAACGPEQQYLATFQLPWRPGTLSVTAYDSTGAVIGQDELTSAGPDLQLSVDPETTDLLANGQDLAYLPITLTDAAGIVRPLADRPVTVEVTGPGSLLGLGSGNPITPEGFVSSSHDTYWGRALAVVRAGLDEGEVTVRVTTRDCKPVVVTLRTRRVATSEPTAAAAR